MTQTSLDNGTARTRRSIMQVVGPAIIVACVVLGPGSILTSSKVGCQFEYAFVWVLLLAGAVMAGAVATAAWVGMGLTESPCTELARRLGRPVAAATGISVFLMASCFQFSNNQGVLASLEPMVQTSVPWQMPTLLVINGLIIACLFVFKHLYQPLERLMMVMVALMLLGFIANLFLTRPSLVAFLRGMVPGLPAGSDGYLLPALEYADTAQEGVAPVRRIVDPWIALQGLVATTFSIAGAFYQAYLVKEKGWGPAELKRGIVDSIIGTTLLVGISLTIMATSASVLYGRVQPEELKSATDVAQQLKPLFGSAAGALFCMGVFGGAASSFLVNSVIGGTMLADGLGLDARLDSKWTKVFTVVTLLIGMFVTMFTDSTSRVSVIILAHAVTVLGGPLLALSLLYLALRINKETGRSLPRWMLVLTSTGAVIVCLLAFRTAWRLALTFQT